MSNSIQFQLLAPYNKAVALIGDFSDWQAIPMEKDDRGYFRTQVDLKDGIYQYKFRVQSISWHRDRDEWVEINDPYVTEIDGPTNNGLVRIKDGQRIIDDYVWQHDDKFLPPDDKLVIYELLVSDFAHNENEPNRRGQYQDVIAKLDYLSELGINAIELMPLNETPGEYSWGYNPSYFFAPQPNYGSTKDLKRLIDECHTRGIRVILDQLYNHSSEESPLLEIDRDYWYYHDHHHPEDPYYWGPEFNYEHYDENRQTFPARDFMGDVVRFWIQEYHVDGIRFDALKQLDNWNLLYWITEEAKRTAGSKPFYNVGEHVPEKPEIISPSGPMDGCWHDSFYHHMESLICDDNFDVNKLMEALDAKRQGYPEGANKVVNYISNHDQKRLLESLGNRNIFGEAAFKRVKLAVTILMTAVGIPMIWMGEEFGESKPTTPDRREPLQWSLLENDDNQDLLKHYKSVIALRKNHPALQTDRIDVFHTDRDNQVIGYVRSNDEGAAVVVVANCSNQVLKNYQIPHFPGNLTFHDCQDNSQVKITDNQLTIDFLEHEAKIFAT